MFSFGALVNERFSNVVQFPPGPIIEPMCMNGLSMCHLTNKHGVCVCVCLKNQKSYLCVSFSRFGLGELL